MRHEDSSPFARIADALEGDWRSIARPEQLPPAGDWWILWLYLGGRGTGKTRSGAERMQAYLSALLLDADASI